jgi:hypothetical protein
MCYVIDNNAQGYFIMFNSPILVYLIAFLYVYFKIGRFVKRGTDKNADLIDSEQNLLSNDPQAKDQYLQNKLFNSYKLIKLYFGLWIVSIIPNLFYLVGTNGITIYNVTSSIHPLITIFVIIRGL